MQPPGERGGGGTLIFSCYLGLDGYSIYCLPPPPPPPKKKKKKKKEYQASQKNILNFSNPQ